MIATAVNHYPKIPNAPRPAKLRQAVTQFQEGSLSLEHLRAVQDEVTEEVLREQAEAGLDLVTDGQVRWDDCATYLAQALEGFRITGLVRLYDTNTYYRRPVADKKVMWKGPILVRDFQFAREHSPKPVKAVITGPYTLARLSLHPAYERFSDFVLDMAKALNQELRALEAEGGAQWIQIDEPGLVFQKRKEDWKLFQEAFCAVVEGVGAQKSLYFYHGDAEGFYPDVLKLPLDLLGLDFVTTSRNWELLQKHPCRKGLGAGILDARNTRLESLARIEERVRKARSCLPDQNLPLHLGPHCGLEFLPRETAYEKLKRLSQAVHSMEVPA